MVVFEAMIAKELNALTQTQRTAFRREIRDRLHDLDQALESADDQESNSGFVMRPAPSASGGDTSTG